MKKMKTVLDRVLFATITLSCVVSCADFIDIDPPKTEIVTKTVFETDASATSAIRGIYSIMMTNGSFTKGGMEEFGGIASDELLSYSTRLDQQQFFQNTISPKNGDLLGAFWTEPYKYINNANSILVGIEQSTGMTTKGKNQLEGEAKFIRAFCHFYLANLYGDVPLITSTDYEINSKMARTPYQEVMQLIETDLLRARDVLSEDYSFSGGERIQPNRGAATALLARFYLYQANWEKADALASELISNSSRYSLLVDMTKVFLPNSQEAIWQLKPVIPGTNTPQGQLFIMTNAPNGSSRRLSLRPEFIAAFEANDQRKVKWTGTFANAAGSWSFISKYKVGINPTLSEYSMVFRLAEQYLIRAEARAQLGNIAGSKADVNSIRTRAGLPNSLANDKSSLLTAIEQERRIELVGESGHRWFDLKRTNRADMFLAPLKPQWQPSDTLFPIPDSERLLNPNLSQNPGY